MHIAQPVTDKRLTYVLSVVDKRLTYSIPVADKRLTYSIPVADKRLTYSIPVADKRLIYSIPVGDKSLTYLYLSLTVTLKVTSRPSAANPRSRQRPNNVVSMLPPQMGSTTLVTEFIKTFSHNFITKNSSPVITGKDR
jgi:hypothetical protein